MIYFIRVITVFFLLLMITACGGSSSSDTPKTTPTQPIPTPIPIPEPSPSLILAYANDYSVLELNKAATELVEARYTGISSEADIDVNLAQRTFLALFNSAATTAPEIGRESFQYEMDADGNINVNLPCTFNGTVRYRGKLNNNFEGHLSLAFDNCLSGSVDTPINGNAAIVYNKLTDTAIEVTYYYDKLNWTAEGQKIQLTGLSKVVTNLNNSSGVTTLNNQQYLLFSIDDSEQILLEANLNLVEGSNVSTIDLAGDMFFNDKGKVSIKFEDIVDLPPNTLAGSMLLNGKNSAIIKFDNPYVLYLEDINNDNVYDVGTYFSDINELLYRSAESKYIVAIADLSLPPEVSRPNLNMSYFDKKDTTTPLSVFSGGYSDPDTPYEDLVAFYRWYINGEIVIGETSDTLPAYIAVYGDDVKVTMLVSDDVNTIESTAYTIELDDAPVQLKYSNVPESVEVGDVVQFLVKISDPDTNTIEQGSVFIAGPEGASFNEDGILSWTVPDDLLFPYQTYHFTFGIPDSNGDISEEGTVAITVKATKALPIARNWIQSPIVNNSMHVGDFDGDGDNEVLSTNNFSSVFLLELYQGKYRQKWVYPFKPKADGRIVQVLSANIDNDNAQEIIVVTNKGMSVINGLDDVDRLLFSTSNYIQYAAVKDINNDGTLEVAYLHKSDEYSNEVNVTVFSIDKPLETLFTTSLGDAKQIILANVDGDESLELISNNGLIYDTSSWNNQWVSSHKFGEVNVTSGDYNGDGLIEIAGANSTGTISIYSAVNKSKLSSLDHDNVCSLYSDDIDNDGADELLVGNCQNHYISAYKMIENEISPLWSEFPGGGNVYSLTVGDSDNDGELEVHWGIGNDNNGSNSFKGANVNDSGISPVSVSTSTMLDKFSSAGWANIAGLEEKAVFFIPSTANGYQGSRVFTLDKLGNYDLSYEISKNWGRSSYAVTNDYNNDGFGDIFLPNTPHYEGSFAAMQLYDNSIQWQYAASNSNSIIGLIKAKDINGDSLEDAIFVDEHTVRAVDISNQVIIGNYTFDSNIIDIVPLSLNNKASVVVATRNKLSLVISNGSVFSEQSSLDQSCYQIMLINFDDDDDDELLCIQESTVPRAKYLVVFEIENLNLVESSRSGLALNFNNIIVDPSKSQQQNLFGTVTVGHNAHENTDSYTIKKLTTEGHVIWESPNLIGEATNHGLKARNVAELGVELMLSTNNMMYWIH